MQPPHSICILVAVLALSGCASSPSSAPQLEEQPGRVGSGAKAVAKGAARGAKAVGHSLAEAYHGVTTGFEEPTGEATFGRYPKHYAGEIRKHFERFLGVSPKASYEFGRPVKGYINEGILLGGEIAWQGYLVDVEIETRSLIQTTRHGYVVRMRDGEVIEVHEAAKSGYLHRVE